MKFVPGMPAIAATPDRVEFTGPAEAARFLAWYYSAPSTGRRVRDTACGPANPSLEAEFNHLRDVPLISNHTVRLEAHKAAIDLLAEENGLVRK